MRAQTASRACWLAAVMLAVGCGTLEALPADALDGRSKGVAGTGNGSIHIIPALSAPSVKNDGTLTIQAVVTSARPVVRVEARFERLGGGASTAPVATVELRPAPARLGGVSASGTAGLWQAEWTAAGLDEAAYAVAIMVRNAAGDTFTDRSLRFSDPIAGRDQVGSASYPDGGMRRIDAVHLHGERALRCAVVDVGAGYAYFGTWTAPGRVLKVALGSGSAPPTRVGALTLESGEAFLGAAVIDTTSGHAYFGTSTSPGRVVKVALGSGASLPVRVGALTLNSGEDDLRSAVIEPMSGHAYFGTGTSPGRVVKVTLGSGASLPTRVGALALGSGEDNLRSAVIDPTSGHAYFGTGTSPGRVVKVAVGSGASLPTRVGALTLDSGENYLAAAVIGQTASYAYFGTSTSPGRVVKVSLGSGSSPPTRAGALTLESHEDRIASAVIDAASGNAYFGLLYSYKGRVVKVATGQASNPPTRVGAFDLPYTAAEPDPEEPVSAAIDVADGFAYFGNGRAVVKAALGGVSGPPSEVATLYLARVSESRLASAVVDAASGHAYFGTAPAMAHGLVLKVALGHGSTPPALRSAVAMNQGDLLCGVIDAGPGHAYFGTDSKQDPISGETWTTVVKVDLGDGSDPPVPVGTLDLVDPEQPALLSAVLDTVSGHALFGMHKYMAPVYQGRVVKVALGSGSNPPTLVGTLALEGSEKPLGSVVFDPASSHAYFGTDTGRVVKVAAGSGSSLPTRVGAVTLESGEDHLRCAVIDTASGFAYFGADRAQPNIPSHVVKVALGSGSNPPARVGAATLETGETWLRSAVIDPSSGYAYFGANSGRIVKVALGSSANPPVRVGALKLASGELGLTSAVIDPASGHAYFGTDGSPASVVRVGLSQQGFIKATRLTMPEAGRVRELRLYSHAATGDVRLALYDTAATPHLLWQSGVLPNTAANAWLATTVAAGTPSSLELPAGTYWLAWQVDTAVPVPSHATGAPGDGLFVPWSWGAFPEALDPAADAAPTLTDEVWSAYLSYEVPTTAVVSAVASPPEGGTVSGGGEVPIGQSVTVAAEPTPGWRFVEWRVAGSPVSSWPRHTFTVAGDIELTAVFRQGAAESIPVAGVGGLLLLAAAVLGAGALLLRRG